MGNLKLLEWQYQQKLPFTDIEPHSVLGSYLSKEHQIQKNPQEETVVYPFGINQSQKTAVENALTSQVSIIQGPPGTGKTQTILNIIANIIMNGQSVAVVSNNNAATKNVLDKLMKYDVGFVAAYLGNKKNKEQFIQQ
ncbi:AAA domain-containing protein [Granulicatella balaenopterae]|uniref:AAA domain-containing protein n=1 Tax=Granulicatella balaenopterae TaxID=137733 RepID=A0A1H9MT99_9LACT|nr:AAA domain-containing protein [Granulicatella balaenopterae]SER26868.1 AAA domain-containing protein [Granulicatella balaenopterae]